MVFGDNLLELEVGVALAIEEELKIKKVRSDKSQLQEKIKV